MEMHGSLEFKGGGKVKNLVLESELSFQASPQPGRVVFANKAVWFCATTESGLPVWVPISQQISMAEHRQVSPSMEWVIDHELQTARPVVQVYDSDGKQVIPQDITAVHNRVTVSFNVPVTGTAVIMRAPEMGSPQLNTVYEEQVASSMVWEIQHDLGRNPQVYCIVGNQVVQPQSIVFDSVNRLTITWSSPTAGTVRLV